MNINKKEDLIEQYEDAAFALMMSEYAEQEGNRLLQEFEEAKARGEIPPIPTELDAKCRNLIRKAYEKEKKKERIKKFLRFTGRTAAIWFATIGICATLVLSVEALRTPVINFIVEQHEKFTTIHLGKEPSSDSSTPSTSGNQTTVQGETPLDGLLPDGYSVVQYSIRDNGTFIAIYENDDGAVIMISSTIGDGAINLDTEKANTITIEIGKHPGLLVEEGTELSIVWYEDAHNISYKIRTTSMMFAEFWDMAEQFAYSNKGG